jgi:hypothetical protein
VLYRWFILSRDKQEFSRLDAGVKKLNLRIIYIVNFIYAKLTLNQKVMMYSGWWYQITLLALAVHLQIFTILSHGFGPYEKTVSIVMCAKALLVADGPEAMHRMTSTLFLPLMADLRATCIQHRPIVSCQGSFVFPCFFSTAGQHNFNHIFIKSEKYQNVHAAPGP